MVNCRLSSQPHRDTASSTTTRELGRTYQTEEYHTEQHGSSNPQTISSCFGDVEEWDKRKAGYTTDSDAQINVLQVAFCCRNEACRLLTLYSIPATNF